MATEEEAKNEQGGRGACRSKAWIWFSVLAIVSGSVVSICLWERDAGRAGSFSAVAMLVVGSIFSISTIVTIYCIGNASSTPEQRIVSEPREEDYVQVLNLVMHADNLTWNRLYYFLVFNSIMLLGWVSVFSGEGSGIGKHLMLVVLAFFGLIVSLLWGPIAMKRGVTFQNYYMGLARCIERKYWPAKHGIFTEQDFLSQGAMVHFYEKGSPTYLTDPQIPRHARFLGARELASFVPWLFSAVYGVLLFFPLVKSLAHKVFTA